MMKMRRILCGILGLTMIFGGTPGAFAEEDKAYTLGADIMIDGGFEEEKWEMRTGFSFDENTVKYDNNSLKVTGGKEKCSLTSPEINVPEGRYRLGMWVKTLELTPSQAITVGLMKNEKVVSSITIDGTMEWEYVSINAVALSGKVNMFIETKAGTTGAAWIDNVTLCPLNAVVYDALSPENEDAEASDIFSDISESEYKKEIEVVYSLGLIDANSNIFEPDLNISREDFAGMITKLLGVSPEKTDGIEYSNAYKDVAEGSKNYGQIMYVTASGYMSGWEDGTFRPKEKVTLNQALKVFVCMLNLEAKAQSSGGYPTGYYRIANISGLLGKIENKGGDTPVTREQMAMLIYNLLEADAYAETGFSSNSVTFGGPRKFAELYLDIKIDFGVVEANQYTHISSAIGCNEGSVIIDGKEYFANLSNAEELLGYNVKYYAKISKNDKDTLLYAYEDRNTVISFEDENIASAELTGDRNFTLKYWTDNNKNHEVKINLTADVIYNGVYCASPTGKDMMPKIGNVKLIDNDNDDVFDIVKTEAAISYRALSVSASRGFITDANGKPKLEFDTDGDDELIIIKDGKRITLDDIKKDDLLFVYRSKDKTLTKIEVYNRTTNGKVKAVSSREVTIGSYKYPVSEALFLNAKEDKNGNLFYEDTNYDKLEPGDNGTIWFDRQGRIIDFDAGRTSEIRYGMLVAGKIDKMPFDTQVTLRLLDEDGKYRDLVLAEKPIIDGQRTETAKTVSLTELIELQNGSKINPIFAGGNVKEQIIEYMLNGDGNISYIDTVNKGKEEDDETLELESSMAERYYYNSTTTLSTDNEVFVPNEDAVIFVVPGTGYSEKNALDYYVGNISELVNKNKNAVEIYNADEMNRSDLMILEKGADNEKTLVDASLMIVTNTGEVVKNDGEICNMIEGMSNGTMTELLCDDTVLGGSSNKFAEIEPGDIIRYTKSASGMLRVLNKVRNVTENSFGRNYTRYDSNNLLVFGKVISKDGIYVMVDVSEKGDGSLPLLFVCGNSAAYVYEYSRSNPHEAKISDISEITEDDMLFLRTNNTLLLDAVIVRN